MARLLRTWLPHVAGALLVLCASCASTGSGSGGDGARLRVTLRDLRQQQHFELVSESHTSRVDYYSQPRRDGARKIEADEIVAALVTELERQGFDRYLEAGPGPSTSHGVLTRAFEVQQDERVEHWAIGQGTAPEEHAAFNECVEAFLQLYNFTSSFQTVENEAGHAFFEGKEPGAERR